MLRNYAIVASSIMGLLLIGSLLVELPKSSIVLSPDPVLKIYSDVNGTNEVEKNANGIYEVKTGSSVYLRLIGVTNNDVMTTGNAQYGETEILIHTLRDYINHDILLTHVMFTDGKSELISWVVGDFNGDGTFTQSDWTDSGVYCNVKGTIMYGQITSTGYVDLAAASSAPADFVGSCTSDNADPNPVLSNTPNAISSDDTSSSNTGSGSTETTNPPIVIRDLAKEKGISAVAKHGGLKHVKQPPSALNSNDDKTKSNNAKKRVLVHNEEEESLARENGCKEIQNAKVLKAFICDKDIAEQLGLLEDFKLVATAPASSGTTSNSVQTEVVSATGRTSGTSTTYSYLTQIKADTVQKAGNTGAARKIAVLDTGYNYNHPELKSSYLVGKDFVNNDNDPMDDNGHGSHVAGIITGDGVNSKAKGVAPSASIIAAKVLDAQGSGYFSNIIAAIYWTIDGPDGVSGTSDDFKPDAINLSVGTSTVYTSTCDTISPEMTTAINYARSKGTVVVVSSGNNYAGVSFPGCISYAIAVGAADSADKIASFSGRGNPIDMVAPGVNIYSSWTGTSYSTKSGTSMSTPMVSGTVALIKFAHPSYTPDQVNNSLLKTPKDLGKVGWDTTFGYGRLDSYAAALY